MERRYNTTSRSNGSTYEWEVCLFYYAKQLGYN